MGIHLTGHYRHRRKIVGVFLLALALGGALAAWHRDVPRGSAPLTYTPSRLHDGWESEALAAAGIDEARFQQALARLMRDQSGVHGLIVERHGKLVAELYRRGEDKQVNDLLSHDVSFGPAVLHDTRSVGKSVIGLLIGIAQQQGKIKNLQTPVIDFYPEFADLATPELKRITLEHLLTMSAGLEWAEGDGLLDDEHHLMWGASPSRYVLSRPIDTQPGRSFNYNSGGTAVLAEILTRVTGTPWDAYAREALFAPLGIDEVEWVKDWRGRPMAYTGLRLRPRDMAKLGRLVLNHGSWRGKQIVPAAWIDASLRPRLDTGFDDTRYGYQWWTGTAPWQGQPLRWGAAFGNGGQRIFVIPELDMTVVVAAGAYDDRAFSRRVNAFFREVVAAVEGDRRRHAAHVGS